MQSKTVLEATNEFLVKSESLVTALDSIMSTVCYVASVVLSGTAADTAGPSAAASSSTADPTAGPGDAKIETGDAEIACRDLQAEASADLESLAATVCEPRPSAPAAAASAADEEVVDVAEEALGDTLAHHESFADTFSCLAPLCNQYPQLKVRYTNMRLAYDAAVGNEHCTSVDVAAAAKLFLERLDQAIDYTNNECDSIHIAREVNKLFERLQKRGVHSDCDLFWTAAGDVKCDMCQAMKNVTLVPDMLLKVQRLGILVTDLEAIAYRGSEPTTLAEKVRKMARTVVADHKNDVKDIQYMTRTMRKWLRIGGFDSAADLVNTRVIRYFSGLATDVIASFKALEKATINYKERTGTIRRLYKRFLADLKEAVKRLEARTDGTTKFIGTFSMDVYYVCNRITELPMVRSNRSERKKVLRDDVKLREFESRLKNMLYEIAPDVTDESALDSNPEDS
jgi:hypothetical protein